MDSRAFLDQLRDLGLLNEEQLAAVSKRFAPEAAFHDVSTALVDQGWLTSFQVEQIWAGKAKGLILGQYRLLEELGRGGFGCVYKALHQIMNRVVALKVISPELVHDSRARTWFRREVLATTQLQHPNIVMAYDANEVDEVLFLVMEYVEGKNLAEVVKKQGPVPVGLACALMLQAARRLQYAHEKGMVHRDIKPANLLLPRVEPAEEPARGSGAFPNAGQVLVKIVDFGLARLQSQGSSNTLVGFKDKGFVGTPDYVSPEQARNIHDVDIRSDLYSLGCTFYYSLTGKAPFRGKTPLEIVLQHLEQEAPSIEGLRPEVPSALVSIVRRLMAKKPEQRFQTPMDLVSELNFFFGSGALLGSATPAPGPVVPPHAKPSNLHAVGADPRQTRLPPPPTPTDLHDDPELPRTTMIPAVALPSDPQLPRPEAVAPARVVETGADCTQEELAPTLNQELPGTWLTEKPRFALLWHQWVGVVENLVQERDPGLGESAYSALHADLRATARAQAERGNAPPALGLVVAVVEPWLSLGTLARTDGPTLASLLQRCCQLERDLDLSRPRAGLGAWAALAALFLMTTFFGAFLINNGGALLQTGFSVSSLWRFMTAHSALTLTLLVPPLVLGSVFVWSRLSRS